MMKKGRRIRQLHPALLALIDVCLIGAALIVFALYDHAWPREMEKDVSEGTLAMIAMMDAIEIGEEEETQESIPLEWKFADRFTDGEPRWEGCN